MRAALFGMLLILESASLMGADENKAVKEQVKRLLATDAAVRQEAAYFLGMLGKAAEGAAPHLARALGDSNPDVSLAAALALAKIGNKAIPCLLKALRSDNQLVRKHAVLAVQRLGPAAPGAVPYLIDMLASKDLELREQAIGAIAAIGPKAKSAVPAVVQLLNDPTLRTSAIRTLGAIGRASRVATPHLIKIMKTEPPKNEDFRALVLRTMVSIDPDGKKLVSTLIESLKHGRRYEICAAAEILAELGERAKRAIPVLNSLLGHKSNQTRLAVAGTLAILEPHNDRASSIITKALADPKLADYAAVLLENVRRSRQLNKKSED